MRTPAPGSLPLFRSDLQANILATLFERHGVETSITDLARFLDAPLSSVAREVDRLHSHDIVAVRRVGRSKLISANWDLRWADALAEMLAQTVGLPADLANAIGGVRGVDRAMIFGSWAARHAGEPGPEPNDLDLLVIGPADFGEVRAALRPLERRLEITINPTIIPTDRWESDDPFVATIRSRPIVALDVGERIT